MLQDYMEIQQNDLPDELDGMLDQQDYSQHEQKTITSIQGPPIHNQIFDLEAGQFIQEPQNSNQTHFGKSLPEILNSDVQSSDDSAIDDFEKASSFKPQKTKLISKRINKLQNLKEQDSISHKKSQPRPHLRCKRRTKEMKNKLQQKVSGYWTKNFLQFAQRPHIMFLKKNKIQFKNSILKFSSKKGVSLEDYEKIYKIKELKDVWIKLFQSKVLYRILMISRTDAKYRVVYVKFLHKFEEAFKTGQFRGISRIEESQRNQTNQI